MHWNGNFWGKKLFTKTKIFIIFGQWADFLVLLSKGVSTAQTKLSFTCPLEQFDERNNFLEKLLFYCFSGIEREVLGFLSKKYRRGCQNCVLRVHLTYLKEKYVFLKTLAICICFRKLSEPVLELSRKFLGGVVNTAVYVSRGTIWGKMLYSKKKQSCSPLSDIELNVPGILAKNFSVWLSQLKSTCPQEHSEGKFNFLMKFCSFDASWTLSKKKSAFFRKKFDGIVKTAFYVSIGNVWRKTFFSLFSNNYSFYLFWTMREIS